MAAYQRGDYEEAVRQTEVALKEAEHFGEHDPCLATSLNNLAEFYRAQGRYTEAEPLYQRARAITEKPFGPEHPNVTPTLNNLAELYRAQGRNEDAEHLLREHGQ